MVEWCLPQDIDLEGVEFKSMASGSHKIQSDFMWVHLSYITSSFLSCASTPPALTSEHARKIPSRKLWSCRNLLAKLFLAEPFSDTFSIILSTSWLQGSAVWLLCLWRPAGEWGSPASHWCANLNVYWASHLHCHYWDCQQRCRVKGKEWHNWNGKHFAGTGLQKMFLTLPGLLVPLNVVINRSHSLSSLLASSLETRKRGIFCILLTQCCNAAMFCNELQCHNSFWSEITVTFLKACEPEPLQSIRVCFNVLEPKIWPGSWTVLRTAFTAGFFLGGRALHWLNHAFCWSSFQVIYLLAFLTGLWCGWLGL